MASISKPGILRPRKGRCTRAVLRLETTARHVANDKANAGGKLGAGNFLVLVEDLRIALSFAKRQRRGMPVTGFDEITLAGVPRLLTALEFGRAHEIPNAVLAEVLHSASKSLRHATGK